MDTPSTAIKQKKKRTPWYEMLMAPPLADLQRQTRIRNSKNMPTAPEYEPSSLERRRLDDDVSTADHENRQLRPCLSITGTGC